MALSKIVVDNLDYFQIKDNLIEFLKSYDGLSDYEYTGSLINTILDVLSYNTYYNSVYSSLLSGEIFLDSAAKRYNVVSHAKQIGYVPTSSLSSRALVSVEISDISTSNSTAILPRGTIFGAPDYQNLVFTTLTDYITTRTDNKFVFDNVELVQGRIINYRYEIVSEYDDIIIDNSNIDLTTLKVVVQDNLNSNNSVEFSRYENLNNIYSDTNVYFLEEIFDGKYKIYFGDNILGKKLSVGNIIILSYVVNDGVYNGLKRFNTNWYDYGFAAVTTHQASFGGKQKESIDSIKYHSPKFFASQNRAVTTTDYVSILNNKDFGIQSINVWGGEDHYPPQYGKVFISLYPKGTTILSEAIKTKVSTEILNNYNLVTIIPEIIEPNFTEICLSLNIYFNKNYTTMLKTTLYQLLKSSILEYFDSVLSNHTKTFYCSDIIELCKHISNGILGIDISYTTQYKFIPSNLNLTQSFIIDFNNKLTQNSIYSNVFQMFIENSYKGVTIIDVPDNNNSGKLFIKDVYSGMIYSFAIGSINYITGRITVDNLKIYKLLGVNHLTIGAIPLLDTFNSYRNQILILGTTTKNTLYNLKNNLEINIIDKN